MYADGARTVTGETLAEGLDASKAWIDDVIELQNSLRSAVGDIEPMEWIASSDYSDEVIERVRSVGETRITEAVSIADKAEREKTQKGVAAAISEELAAEFSELDGAAKQISAAVRAVTKECVRKRIAEDRSEEHTSELQSH